MKDFLSLYFLNGSKEVELYDPEEDSILSLEKEHINDLLKNYECVILYDAFDFYRNFIYSGKVIDVKLIINTLLECTNLKNLYNQYYYDECTQYSKIIYKLYEVYKNNGAFSFVLEKHDLYLSIIKRYAISVKKNVFSLDIDAIVEKKNSFTDSFNEVIDRLSSYTGYKVNVHSRLDLEDLLFNKMSLSYYNYSEFNLKNPFIYESLCKLKNDNNVVCDVLYAKKLLISIKTIDSLVNLSNENYHYSHSVKSSTSIGIVCDSHNISNLFCSEFLPFSSSKYGLFYFQLVEPELYTLFKWSLDSKLSEYYENGNSINNLISNFLNIDCNSFSSFVDIMFSENMKNCNDIYLFNNHVCDYNVCVNKLLSMKSLSSFLKRVISFYHKNKYIKSFNGSPVFLTSESRLKNCILYTIGKLSVLENVYKIINSLPDDIYLVYSYHGGFVFASNLSYSEIHSVFDDSVVNSTYPFRYKFHIDKIDPEKL